ncbi:MAG TPA: DUF3108 domain-containing protein [Thiomicrospira sp.]|jgi:hypothetical protein|nr:DUF3108 domain-containing protein [Thiomicrospira sp.]
MFKAYTLKTKFNHFLSRTVHASMLAIGFALVHPAHATELRNFKAVFDVEAVGLTLGQAKHSMHCKDSICTLKSDAKPSGFAAAFFKDSSHETIKLKQNDTMLSWLSYSKLGISYKDDKAKEKTIHLQLNAEKNSVICPEQQREWPVQPQLFDVISISYAIQHAKLNDLPLTNLTLQDTNFQDKLKLKSTDNNDFLEFDFADNHLDAVKYHFTSKHAEIELWLLPKYDYFPGKIRIVNKKEKTITLSLAEPPKIL